MERGRARSHGLSPNSIRCGSVGRGVIDVAVVQHGQRIVADRGTSPPAGTGGGCRRGGRPDRCRLGSSGAQRLGVIGHEASGELVAGHLGPVEQRGEEPQVRRHAVDAELAQGPARPADRVGVVTARAVGDHLGEQRVEAGVRAISHVAVGVSAQPWTRGGLEGGEHTTAWARGAVWLHRLGVDAALDGVPARRWHVGLSQPHIGKAGAASDSELRSYQVDAGDFLGDRVLDLDASIDLAEGDRARVVGVDEEFPGAQAAVADCSGHLHRGVTHRLAGIGRERGRGCDLHDLLVLALQRAFPLAQMGNRLAVPDDLDLDVAGALDQLLHVEIAIAERGGSLAGAALIGGLELVRRAHHAHAAPAAPGQGLDHHRPVLGEEGLCGLDRSRLGRGGQQRYVVLLRERPRCELVAEELELERAGPHEGDVGGLAGKRQGRVLGQESVAGMDRIAAGLRSGADHLVDIEVGGHAASVERDRLIGHTGVQ